MDQQTGVVLAESNASERLPMASTTKIMTGLLVLEHFHDLDTVVAARRDAVGVGEDEIYLQRGEQLTVDQLLQALLIQSANDAAADLADAVAGSQASFVALMNQRARELGLTNTHYANPHGLDAARPLHERPRPHAPGPLSPCATRASPATSTTTRRPSPGRITPTAACSSATTSCSRTTPGSTA